jgi:hypothetical protein
MNREITWNCGRSVLHKFYHCPKSFWEMKRSHCVFSLLISPFEGILDILGNTTTFVLDSTLMGSSYLLKSFKGINYLINNSLHSAFLGFCVILFNNAFIIDTNPTVTRFCVLLWVVNLKGPEDYTWLLISKWSKGPTTRSSIWKDCILILGEKASDSENPQRT